MLDFYVHCSVLPRPFSEGGTPCRFLVTPCPFQEAEMTPCPFLGDAQRRPVTFYLTPNVTVHGNRRGNYAACTFPLFYSTAFVIVIRLVYKNLRYWPIRIYFGRLAHGGIRYGALSSQRSHSNAYAVSAGGRLLMAQTQSIIVTCTGFHAFGT